MSPPTDTPEGSAPEGSAPEGSAAESTVNKPAGRRQVRAWAARIIALALLSWVIDSHGGLSMIEAVATKLGGRWPLLLLPWAARVAIALWAYRTSLPDRGREVPLSVLGRVQIAGGALNSLLPLGASSSNILKVGLLRHWYSAEALVAAGVWGSLGTGLGNAIGALGPVAALAVGYGEAWVPGLLALAGVAMAVPSLIALAFVSKGLSERVARWLTVLPVALVRNRRQGFIDWAARLDVHLAAAIGERRGDFRMLVALRGLYQVARVAEIWLAVELLGMDGGLLTALLFNSMSRTLAQILRFIPGRLGVLEVSASAMFIGLGLDPQSGVALSLALRGAYLADLITSFTALSTLHSFPERYPPRATDV